MRDVFPSSRSLQANRCFHLVSSSLACLCSFLGQSSRPWGLNSSKIQSFKEPLADPPRGSHWEGYWWMWLAGVTFLMMTLVGTTMEWAPSFLKQISTQEEPGCNSLYVVAGTMKACSWGPWAGSLSTWTYIQCPQMSVWLCPNEGMVTLFVVWTHPWISPRQNPLYTVRSWLLKGVPLPGAPVPLAHSRGICSDPDITVLEWACLQIMVALASSPFVIIPISLLIIFDPTTTSIFSA